MNLTLQLADNNLLLNLASQPPLSIDLTDALRSGLEDCYETYADLRQSGDNAALLALGERLAELIFNGNPQLLRQWLDAPGTRQLTVLAEADNDELLLRLPWEILAADGQFLAAAPQPFEVIRRAGQPAPTLRQPQYRDLTLVFMAADPELSSGLSYEAEERAIFAAARTCRTLNLIVDESGSLDGLRSRLLDTAHCDVLHLSCHGSFDPERGFVLHLEDRQFGLLPATAHDFIPLRDQFSTLFLSACHSAEHRDHRSLLVDLARLGIANLVGWDGAVADEDATRFAQHFYQALQFEETVPAACALARQAMLREGCPYWHSARCCLGPEGGLPLISRRQPKSPKRCGRPCHELLDNKKGEVQVASRETFVGRRWQTKEALHAFAEQRPVLLYGIGGTGKSSLAARIVDRLEPRCKAAVLYRHYQAIDLLDVLQDAARDAEIDFAALLAKVQADPGRLKGILLSLLEGIFDQQPIVLVADDLEQHILEPLPAQGDKAEVKREYQSVFKALIEAFAEADTDSRLLLTSRCCFTLRNRHGEDMCAKLRAINVPDMTVAEQEKHWLALLQRDGGQERDKVQDAQYLERIFAAAQGNPGLQAVLFPPLLKGELAALDSALQRIAASQAKLEAASPADEVDKYFQRIALEVYSRALSNSEREFLRLLTLFEVPVPEELLLQAGPKAGIADLAAALRRLDNFGLLCHWQGRDVDGHISCYGLARKVVEPLGREDRNSLAKICAPLLWRIWFKDFLAEYAVPETETLKESVDFIFTNHFPSKYKGELPLSGETDQRRIAALHRLCIRNCTADWEKIGCDADTFINYLELSLSLHVFEKLLVSSAALNGLSVFQFTGINKVFDEERGKFQELTKEHPQDIIRLMFSKFSGRGELLRQAYLFFFGELDKTTEKLLQDADLTDEENRLNIALQLAKTDKERADAYHVHADFLADQKQDYAAAEVMYERAIEADPNHARNLGNYAVFLENQKQDYAAAEAMYERAVEADPNHARNLGNYADLLEKKKGDYAAAEAMYERAIEADPNHARNLGSYANFLADQKQDYAAAETMYERAVEADPNHANILGNYALFLKNQKQDYAAAEAMYERAIEADPNHARNLGSYANFLWQQNQDYAAAEAMYERAIEADPNHARNLGNYAYFLHFQKQDYVAAEAMYERAVEADPKDARNLGSYALFLKNQKQDYAAAEAMYERAVEADPNHANTLGNYALFLKNQKQDYAAAEAMYQRAVQADKKDADILGNYVYFLHFQKQDYVAAEAMYERAAEADPKHARNLGNYALFLWQQKQDYATADAMYERAVEADPNHARNLGSYANFLWQQKQDYAAAEAMYERAVEADPNHARNLGNYANFLWQQKQDYAAAEAMYERAVEADPNHTNNLGNYAIFLDVYKKNYAAAEKMYQRAVETAPENANTLGNYARLLFVRGERTKAIEMLERAELHQEKWAADLHVELAFYRYAHCQPQPLSPLKKLLLHGVRSLGWNLTDNVRRAEQDGHPNPALLAALAEVISNDQPIETLEKFEEWSIVEPEAD